MSLYHEICEDLLKNNIVKELYRFQGGKSFQCFDIKTNKFIEDDNKYVYFSSNLEHHKYFMLRRIRQYINNNILNESEYLICRNQLSNYDSYNNIKNILINNEKIKDLKSIKLIYDKNYYKLICDNYSFSDKKFKNSGIEKVDRRIHGSGYGISEEWKNLLSHMMFFSCIQKISQKDILQLIYNMRTSGKILSIKNIDFLIRTGIYQINSNIFSDFSKYDIMNDLEIIIEKKLCLESSELYNNPSKTIKFITSSYQENKVKVLKLLEKNYKL